MWRVLAEGLAFPEGPVALADGAVLLVEIATGWLTRVEPDGRVRRLVHAGGGPNGAAIGPDGAVYLCNNCGVFDFEAVGGVMQIRPSARLSVRGSIQRCDLESGRVETVYADCEGRPLYSPNDIAFDSAGGFWFTCSGAAVPDGRAWGGLYYAEPGGGRVTCVRDRLLCANGVGLSPDERVVYVADTFLQRLWAFDVTAPGELAPPLADGQPGRIVANLPGWRMLDSLAVQADGAVCVATLFDGGITVFEPNEGVRRHVPTPDHTPTNLCFGGAGMQDVWVTGAGLGVLYHGRWPTPGAPLPFNR